MNTNENEGPLSQVIEGIGHTNPQYLSDFVCLKKAEGKSDLYEKEKKRILNQNGFTEEMFEAWLCGFTQRQNEIAQVLPVKSLVRYVQNMMHSILRHQNRHLRVSFGKILSVEIVNVLDRALRSRLLRMADYENIASSPDFSNNREILYKIIEKNKIQIIDENHQYKISEIATDHPKRDEDIFFSSFEAVFPGIKFSRGNLVSLGRAIKNKKIHRQRVIKLAEELELDLSIIHSFFGTQGIHIIDIIQPKTNIFDMGFPEVSFSNKQRSILTVAIKNRQMKRETFTKIITELAVDKATFEHFFAENSIKIIDVEQKRETLWVDYFKYIELSGDTIHILKTAGKFRKIAHITYEKLLAENTSDEFKTQLTKYIEDLEIRTGKQKVITEPKGKVKKPVRTIASFPLLQAIKKEPSFWEIFFPGVKISVKAKATLVRANLNKRLTLNKYNFLIQDTESTISSVLLDEFIKKNKIEIGNKKLRYDSVVKEGQKAGNNLHKAIDYSVWFERKYLTVNVIELLEISLSQGYMKKLHFLYLTENCNLPVEKLRSFLVGQGLFFGKPSHDTVIRKRGSVRDGKKSSLPVDDEDDKLHE